MKKNDQMVSAGTGLGRKMLGVCALVIPLIISACSSPTGTPTVNPAPATAAPMATITPQQNTVQNQLDPCQLIDSQEASSLTGTTLGVGRAGSTGYGLKSCRYVATTNILTVEVAQEQNAAAAKSDQAKFLADTQSNMGSPDSQLNVTQLPGLADGAVMLDTGNGGSGSAVNGMAIGFVKGTIFFDISDVSTNGSPAPTSAVMQSERPYSDVCHNKYLIILPKTQNWQTFVSSVFS